MRISPFRARSLAGGYLLPGLLALLLPACAGGASAAPPLAPPASMASDAPSSPAAQPSAAGEAANEPGGPPAAAASAAKSSESAVAAKSDEAELDEAGAAPLLIYEADLTLELPKVEFPTAIDAIIDAAERHGGYLVSRSADHVTVRVRSTRFRAALKALGEAGEVVRNDVTARDVSEQFHDLEVRLKNLRAVRARLEQFLARAKNVNEALAVGAKLDEVSKRIDVIEGKLRYLKNRTSYSLVRVALRPSPERKQVVQRPEKPAEPPPPRAAALPVEWFDDVGLDPLLKLKPEDGR